MDGIRIEDIRAMVSTLMDSKLDPIQTDIDNIKVKLGNHMEHFALEFSTIRTDVAWLKKLFNSEKITSSEAKNSTDLAWLKKAFWTMVGFLSAIAASLIAHVFKLI